MKVQKPKKTTRRKATAAQQTKFDAELAFNAIIVEFDDIRERLRTLVHYYNNLEQQNIDIETTLTRRLYNLERDIIKFESKDKPKSEQTWLDDSVTGYNFNLFRWFSGLGKK